MTFCTPVGRSTTELPRAVSCNGEVERPTGVQKVIGSTHRFDSCWENPELFFSEQLSNIFLKKFLMSRFIILGKLKNTSEVKHS